MLFLLPQKWCQCHFINFPQDFSQVICYNFICLCSSLSFLLCCMSTSVCWVKSWQTLKSELFNFIFKNISCICRYRCKSRGGFRQRKVLHCKCTPEGWNYWQAFHRNIFKVIRHGIPLSVFSVIYLSISYNFLIS